MVSVFLPSPPRRDASSDPPDIDPRRIAVHIVQDRVKLKAVLLVQADVIRREPDRRDLRFLCKALGLPQQQPREAVAPIRGERVDKSHPRSEVRRLNVVPLREGAVGDQRVAVCEQEDLRALSDGLEKRIRAQKSLQERAGAPVAFPDLLQPVRLPAAVVIFDNFHADPSVRDAAPHRTRLLSNACYLSFVIIRRPCPAVNRELCFFGAFFSGRRSF